MSDRGLFSIWYDKLSKVNRVMKDSFALAWEILATDIYKDIIQIIFGCFLRYRTQCLQAITIETQVLFLEKKNQKTKKPKHERP